MKIKDNWELSKKKISRETKGSLKSWRYQHTCVVLSDFFYTALPTEATPKKPSKLKQSTL